VTRCTKHYNARAAWRCTKCGADLCPGCAAEDSIHGSKIVRCATCGGVAEVLMIRKEIVPYWGMFGEFLKAIFTMEGLLQFLGLAVVLYLVSWVPLIGGILYGGVWVSYYFLVIHKASTGTTKLPMPADFTDFVDDMVLPLIRFILASLILVIPTYLYVRSQVGFLHLFVNPREALADPVLLLIITLSVVYFPAAIITAAIARSTIAMLNPAVILGIILRIPGHYFLTVLVWAADAAAGPRLHPGAHSHRADGGQLDHSHLDRLRAGLGDLPERGGAGPHPGQPADGSGGPRGHSAGNPSRAAAAGREPARAGGAHSAGT
jgi:uncharacterized membrane protein